MDRNLVEECEQLTIETQELGMMIMRPFYERHKINYLKLSVLREVSQSNSITLNTLSQKLGKAAANLSVVISEMEKDNLVQRVRSVNDRRVTFIQPKDKGKKISDLSYEHIAKAFSDIFGEGEIFEELIDVLERYKEKLQTAVDSM
ncbi:MarR family winged helix-turn-helix transcriptional regulator [Breznakia pachnodae]|uniref:DNA-binding MarR family transcriptional regulator n=1 Tax=Breznakia pachnodae TaxID=265178 RepID=A0ABU0E4L4_9FIRM|nr:MarR family transcriptional regulator [Breznakia pachnodae]MDQ0361755.1 DNA-binding MarR family transcriptional regulator [Breznakia pachnodae]